MPRFAAGGRGVTNLPTTKRGPNLFAGASAPIRLREVGVFNTTATEFAVALLRATGAGTTAGALTEEKYDTTVVASGATINTSQSADATISDLAKVVRQATVPGAKGAGVIWTFGAEGLIIPAGTTNGVVLTCPTGTAQFFDFYFEYDS